jgi:hypothetical protein
VTEFRSRFRSPAQKKQQQIRLEVKIPTPTMLKVLWTANIAKGTMSIETQNEIPEGMAVRVALQIPGKEIELPAKVRGAVAKKDGKGFFVSVQFDEIAPEHRELVERITAGIKEYKSTKKSAADETDIDLGEDE